jgi:hypothetical protein
MKKFSTKYLETEFNNTLKISYTMVMLISFEGCNDGSKYISQEM